jgi:hypothetical protein
VRELEITYEGACNEAEALRIETRQLSATLRQLSVREKTKAENHLFRSSAVEDELRESQRNVLEDIEEEEEQAALNSKRSNVARSEREPSVVDTENIVSGGAS